MDWRDWVVNERFTTDKYWLDIANGRSNMGGFFNIKILKKEGYVMQELISYLAELQNEMMQLENKDINSIVDEKVVEYRTQVLADETAKKADAINKKQAELDALNRIIDRVRAADEAKVVEETANENNENI